MNDIEKYKLDEQKYRVDKLFNPNFTHDEKLLILKAYAFASASHEGVSRSSGEPYFSHPYDVALLLSELNMDAVSVACGLLHDTVEDVEDVTTKTIREIFGNEVAVIVNGVTKITHLHEEDKELKLNENLRKMILFMAKDIRVVIVKLADRLHNMRTLNFVREEKQKRVSRETREIYAPLANRLGMHKIKSELEDLSMRYLEPEAYRELANKINMKKDDRVVELDRLKEYLEKELEKRGIKNFLVYGRTKHFYSIYRKLSKGHSFEEIHDLSALRVITKDAGSCYIVLGAIHEIWQNIPNRFKDYIGKPKDNGYQSLHTTVITHTGKLIEVQIRTRKMHEIAEEGIAAHWRYKENIKKAEEDKTKYIEEKLGWIRKIKDWASEMNVQRDDFVEGFKMDILGDQILCFTPNGEVLELPAGSTPVDFAYNIHTEVGEQCNGAKVTRDDVTRIIPLNSELQNFDVVEIITKKNSHPGKDWLSFVKTGRARTKIKQYFKSAHYQQNHEKGKEILIKSLKNNGLSMEDEEAKRIIKLLMRGSGGITSEDAIYADIGFSNITESELTHRIKQYIEAEIKRKEKLAKKKKNKKNNKKDTTSGSKILIEGMKNIPIKYAKCCNPLPGDDVYGYITRVHGISIHKSNCPNFLRLKAESDELGEADRIIKVNWKESDITKPLRVKIIAQDNEMLITEIYDKLRGSGATIININTTKISNNKKKVELVMRGTDSTDEKQKYLRLLRSIKYIQKANISE